MKVLVVSNLYPPYFVGGYELGCLDIVEGLKARGHVVHVTTSDFRNSSEPPPNDSGVNRELRFQPGGGLASHYAESRKFNAILREFSPDLVYFWNMAGLCPWLPWVARWRGFPIVFFLSDTTFLFWRVGAWLTGAAQKNILLKKLPGGTFLVKGCPVLRNSPCHFTSNFLHRTAIDGGIKFDQRKSKVIHWGVVPSKFDSPTAPRPRWPVSRLLYVGQISRLKGIHTAVAALGELAKKGRNDLRLTIVGGGSDPAYEEELKIAVRELGIENQVNFHGKVNRSAVANLYAENDILIFPSEWAEPFAITPLEAIAAGLVVIGTTTGGSGELFHDGKTALTFRAGDPVDCARAIDAACRDQALFQSVQETGRREVRTTFTLEQMLSSIESSLKEIAKAP